MVPDNVRHPCEHLDFLRTSAAVLRSRVPSMLRILSVVRAPHVVLRSFGSGSTPPATEVVVSIRCGLPIGQGVNCVLCALSSRPPNIRFRQVAQTV
eukprot:scaffold266531_cov30-Tisochrysis_lutea.AAC.1